jgi:hypothetical protein
MTFPFGGACRRGGGDGGRSEAMTVKKLRMYLEALEREGEGESLVVMMKDREGSDLSPLRHCEFLKDIPGNGRGSTLVLWPMLRGAETRSALLE